MRRFLIVNIVTFLVLFALFFEDSRYHFWSLIRWAYLEKVYTYTAIILVFVNMIALMFHSGKLVENTESQKNEDYSS